MALDLRDKAAMGRLVAAMDVAHRRMDVVTGPDERFDGKIFAAAAAAGDEDWLTDRFASIR